MTDEERQEQIVRRAQSVLEQLNKKEYKQLQRENIIEANMKSINGAPLDNMKYATLVYHGSRNGIIGNINPNSSRALCDFGKAFYTGNNKQQAELLIKDNGSMKLLYSIYADLNPNELSIYTFNDLNKESCKLLAFYIAHNRHKIDIHKYPKLKTILAEIDAHDIIIGLIADDEMTQAFNEFIADALTLDALFYCLSKVKLGHQYCFKTQKSCDHLHYLDIKPYSKENDMELEKLHEELKQQNNDVVEEAKDLYYKGPRFRELIKEFI